MSSMLKFRLWVLLGSVLMVLVCRGLKDLSGPPTVSQAADHLTPAGADATPPPGPSVALTR